MSGRGGKKAIKLGNYFLIKYSIINDMLLTIDIGTSSFKSALWDLDINDGKKNRLSFVSIPVSFETQKSDYGSSLNEEYKHEIEPSVWLTAFAESCQKLLIDTDLKNLNAVKAIIISGNGPSLVPVPGESFFSSKFEAPAHNALLWLDRRAVKYQERVSEVMGGFVDASFFLPKIFYLKNDENEIYNKTKYFLGCPEYLAFALTGTAKTVFPCEGFDRWFWNDSALSKLELDKAKFPAFIRPGDQFGTIFPSAAQYFGFSKDIPVISGGPDFFAAILGSGVNEAGQVCDRSGSSEGINLCTKNHITDERLMSYGHPVKPLWNLSGIINTSGTAIEWGRNILGIRSFNDFITVSKSSKPGSKGVIFTPYLAGERAPLWDTQLRAKWRGVGLSSGRSEFANSILESIGFAIRDVINVMEQSGACGVSQLRVTGGLADCGRLNQIKADITGKQVLAGIHKDEELLGLAIIGACLLGKYSSYKDASNEMCKIEKTYEPDVNNKKIYDDLFGEYIKNRK